MRSCGNFSGVLLGICGKILLVVVVAAGIVSVGRGHELPCARHSQFYLAWQFTKTEPISEASVKTNLRKGKQNLDGE